MARFNVSGDRLGVPTLTDVSTTPLLALGTVVRGYDDVSDTNGEYMYVRFGAAGTVGQPGLIDLHNKVTLASNAAANSGKPVGIIVAPVVADGDYGFVQIGGKAVVKSNAAVADAKVMLTAVAGTVDDAALAGCQLIGAEFATADGTPAAGFAYVNLNRPAVQSQIT